MMVSPSPVVLPGLCMPGHRQDQARRHNFVQGPRRLRGEHLRRQRKVRRGIPLKGSVLVVRKHSRGGTPPLSEIHHLGNSTQTQFRTEFHQKRPRICANQRSRAADCAIQIYQTPINKKVRNSYIFLNQKCPVI